MIDKALSLLYQFEQKSEIEWDRGAFAEIPLMINVEEVLPAVIEEMEADSFTSYNFNRVTSQQAKHLVFDNRFRPVSRFHPRSITVVKDSQPGQSAEYFELIDPLAEQPK